MTLAAEVKVKWSVILMDRLGPDIFSTLRMKGHVLHHAHAHLNWVLGWSLVWNALLIEKLPMFLSRLHEINGGGESEKILPVSGSFSSNFKNDGFYSVVVRVNCEGEWNSISYIPSVMFVVLTADQIFGRADGRLNNTLISLTILSTIWQSVAFPCFKKAWKAAKL